MRPTQFGSWFENRMAHGRTYYYNSRTGVSQWNMPEEWQQYNQQMPKGYQLGHGGQIAYAQGHSIFFPGPPPNFLSYAPPPPLPMDGYQYPVNENPLIHGVWFNCTDCVSGTLQPHQPPPPPPPPITTQHEFAKPMLPAYQSTRSSKGAVRSSPNRVLASSQTANINVYGSNTASSSKNCEQRSPVISQARSPRIISVENNQPDPLMCSPPPPTADADDEVSTIRTPSLVPANCLPLDRPKQKRMRREVGDVAEEIPVKKPANATVYRNELLEYTRGGEANESLLQPWARFYKPELAKKLQEKLHIERIDEFMNMRDASFILERKLIDKLVNLKAAAAMREVAKHEATMVQIKKTSLQEHQQLLCADMQKNREELAEIERREQFGQCCIPIPMDISP